MKRLACLTLCAALLTACGGDHKRYPNDTLACKNYRSQLTGPTPHLTVERMRAACLASRRAVQTPATQ
ncbi:MAG: hypothetical protein ABF544_08260 [Acetobacter orientalis]|uniref:hypothetical protein n=1 Tax=Acetobacter orientalis TaxID=146474 RepID=UPI0039E7E016